MRLGPCRRHLFAPLSAMYLPPYAFCPVGGIALGF